MYDTLALFLFCRNSRHSKEKIAKRPKTAEPSCGKIERPSRLSLGGGNINQPTKRPGRKSIGGIIHQPKMAGVTKRTVQPRAQKRLSLQVEIAQPRTKARDVTGNGLKRPSTAFEAKRTSRTLAANFAK